MSSTPIKNGNGTIVEMLSLALSGSENTPMWGEFLKFKHMVELGVFGDNIKHVRKFGKNDSVSTGNFEVIWPGQDDYTGFFFTPVSLEIVSSEADDTAAGSGARTVLVSGQNEDGDMKEELLALNGVTPVPLSGLWTELHRATVVSFGGDNNSLVSANSGDISVREVGTPANVAAIIPEEYGQTVQAIYRIPNGYWGILLNSTISTSRGDEGRIRFMARNLARSDSPLVVKDERQVYGENYHEEFAIGIRLDEGIDMLICAQNDAQGNMRVSASFELLLIKKGFVDGI